MDCLDYFVGFIVNIICALNILCGLPWMHSLCFHGYIVLVTANILFGVLQTCSDCCPAVIFRKSKSTPKFANRLCL